MQYSENISEKRLSWKKDWHGWSIDSSTNWEIFHRIERMLMSDCFEWLEVNLLPYQSHVVPEEPGIYILWADTPQVPTGRKHELYVGESGKSIRSRFLSHCKGDKLASITMVKNIWDLQEINFQYTRIKNWEYYSDIKKFVRSVEWLYVEMLGPAANREHGKKDIKEVSSYIEKEYYKVVEILQLLGVA